MQQNLAIGNSTSDRSSLITNYSSTPGYSYADFLDAIVRDRRSSNASISSKNGIFRSAAILRKVSRVGDIPPLNHLDQTEGSISVSRQSFEYDNFKNSSFDIVDEIVLIPIYFSHLLMYNSIVYLSNKFSNTWRDSQPSAYSNIRLFDSSSQPARIRLGNGYAIHLKPKRNITYEYITSGKRSLPPSNCIVLFRRGGAVK